MKWFRFNDRKDTIINLEEVECIQTNMKFEGDSYIYEIKVKTKNSNVHVVKYERVFEGDFTSDFKRLYDMFK